MGTLRISSSEIKSICLSRLWLGLLASALVLVLAGSVLGQRPTTLFTKTYGGTGDDVGYCVEQTSDGGFMIVAKTNSFGAGSYDIYVLRTDAYGDTLWHRTYGQTGYEDANKIRETVDGGFVIAGRTQNGDDDAYLLKIDAGGDTVWTRTYGGGSNDQVFGVEQTADGGYILVGTTRSYGAGTPGYSNAWVIRTDANGYILWTNTYGGSSGDAEFHSVKELPSGGFVLTGHSESFTAEPQFYILAMDADGDSIWHRAYGGGDNEEGRCVQIVSDGNYIFAGRTASIGAGDSDLYLIKTDTNGDSLWHRTYGGSDDDRGQSVRETADGGFLFAGKVKGLGAGLNDGWVIKTDADGDTVWTQVWGGVQDEVLNCIHLTTDGGYVAVGYTASEGAGGNDVYLVKTCHCDTRTVLQVPSEYPTITLAMACADFGDEIQVAGGTYYEHDIVMKDGVSLIGAGSATAIIDGQNLGRVIYCENLGSSTLIQGFTITNGTAANGGGIYCTNASPAIVDCIIDNNTATSWGGGIHSTFASPDLTDCILTDNSAVRGGGFWGEDSDGAITGCRFEGNTVTDKGGAIYLTDGSTPEFRECQIISNDADQEGGGIHCQEASNFTLDLCTLDGNTSGNFGGGISTWNTSPVIDSCTVTNNTAVEGGGGMRFNYSASLPQVTYTTISGNSAEVGGGVMCGEQARPTIEYCVFTGNRAVGRGGAIEYGFGATRTITNCTFVANLCDSVGGAIYVKSNDCHLNAVNLIVWGNRGIDGGDEVYVEAGAPVSSITFDCCDVDSSGIEGPGTVSWGSANLFEDPLLCGPAPWETAPTTEGDYHLQCDSPCLDAGSCGLIGAYGRGCFGEAPYILSITDVGNDQGRQVRIAWERSIYDAAGDSIDITGYGVYRRQDQYLSMPENRIKTEEQKPAILGLAGWDYAGYVPARGDSLYQFVTATLCDSTIDGICWSTFFISAMTSDPLVYFDSYPDSGYSVDNLAPCMPCGIGGDGDGADVFVYWAPNTEEDLCRYRVYRGADSTFGILEALAVYEACDTTVVIEDLSGDPNDIYYYRVTAIDFSGNESEPSTAVGICAQGAGVDDSPEPIRFSLSGGRPNPFTSATSIAFSIPARQHVNLEIYDVNGRLVSMLVDAELDAGRHHADWDGTNSDGNTIPAGIYFSRLESGGKRATEKVILVR